MNLQLSPEISAALEAGRPVVALESTVIAHGLPYPQNLETALRLEETIREKGVEPATIAVLDGALTVGLGRDQLERIATDPSFRKITTRDLAVAVAKKLNCATTVASTSFVAHLAGIKVFSTGGIGGVHRGYASDVSADLPELARTPITLVCSGPKIVLDIAATREWLETYGVTVLGWNCDEMPAFYTRNSGSPVDERVGTPDEVAAIVTSRDALGLRSAVLVAVPVPETAEISCGELEKFLADSLGRAEEDNIAGKDITPYLLSEMSRRSQGRTLTANLELLENNARVAAQIAVALTD